MLGFPTIFTQHFIEIIITETFGDMSVIDACPCVPVSGRNGQNYRKPPKAQYLNMIGHCHCNHDDRYTGRFHQCLYSWRVCHTKSPWCIHSHLGMEMAEKWHSQLSGLICFHTQEWLGKSKISYSNEKIAWEVQCARPLVVWRRTVRTQRIHISICRAIASSIFFFVLS